MRTIIDTSSLLSLVRYYLPFDKNNSLKNFVEDKFTNGEIILLDKVYDECKYVARGIVLDNLAFLKPKPKWIIDTISILPEQKLFKRLASDLSVKIQRDKLQPIEFESEQSDFLNSADGKLILYCLEENKNLNIEKLILVTEETGKENDGKTFKKLPELCRLLGIEYCNLPTLFRDHFKLKLSSHVE